MKKILCGALLATLPGLALAEGKTTIDPDKLLAHIKTLSSDEFEGRLPGAVGETKTVDYLIKTFKAIGLEPGNPEGGYVQPVPLVGLKATPTMQLSGCGAQLKTNFPTDFVAGTTQVRSQVAIKDSDLVFVGYGISAPELGWDDYKGVDVKGKTLVMLIGDPAIVDPNNPGQLDDSQFKGKALTYYGRWTYKYEIAAAKGAAGALIIHETEPASYPWDVVQNGWNGERFVLKNASGNAGQVPVRGWYAEATARQLLKACGQDLDVLKKQALRKDFKPVALPAKTSVTINNTLRELVSQNVLGKITGSDPARKDELIVYTAHWDHFGKKIVNGKPVIYRGAIDNASGVAAITEIARAFKESKTPPKRSLLFLAVTAEEQGLLGAAHYAEAPLYPLKKTIANLNIDVMNPWGRTRDINVVGYGQTNLDELLKIEAKKQGRIVNPESAPQEGFYFRSDHFELVKKGVPALYFKGGIDVIGRPAGFGRDKADEYTQHDYHKGSDEVKAGWDLRGAAEDADLMLGVGRQLVDELKAADFSEGSEFKAARAALMNAEKP